ncbi:unannotated protein [freshwater metagenome]|uniref:Unannotated protein n=1 Tax=freshwater metagenome TaxID=449393 RepID=A0A6J7D8I2_9ZZZZ|nr:hypothetical protein [Actinomycetota bacterium]
MLKPGMKDIWAEMEAGQPIVGSFVVSASPAAVEIVGHAGWDFVIVDCEHAAMSPYGTELEACVRAAFAADVTPLVRTTGKDGAQVLKAANFGAAGVMVPHVNTAEEVARLLSYCKLPPYGNRSSAPPVRAANYGWTPFAELVEHTANSVHLIPIFEEPEAFENLDEILDVPGLKVVCHGPYDLAARLGGIGDPEAERLVDELLDELVAKSRERGLLVMNLAWGPESLRHQIEKGCTGIVYSTDVTILNAAMREHRAAVLGELAAFAAR